MVKQQNSEVAPWDHYYCLQWETCGLLRQPPVALELEHYMHFETLCLHYDQPENLKTENSSKLLTLRQLLDKLCIIIDNGYSNHVEGSGKVYHNVVIVLKHKRINIKNITKKSNIYLHTQVIYIRPPILDGATGLNAAGLFRLYFITLDFDAKALRFLSKTQYP